MLIIVGDSAVTVPRFKAGHPDGQFDYILVDGNHDKRAARRDLENVSGMLAPAGILIFDDIAEDGCGLDDVWQQFKKGHPAEYLCAEDYGGKGVAVGVRKGDQSWPGKRTSAWPETDH